MILSDALILPISQLQLPISQLQTPQVMTSQINIDLICSCAHFLIEIGENLGIMAGFNMI